MMDLMIKILRIHFIWPVENSQKIYFTVVTLLTIPFYLGIVGHMVYAITEKNGIEIDVDIVLTTSQAGMYYVIVCYLFNVKELIKIFRVLSDFEQFGKPPGYEAFEKEMETFTKFLYICTNTGFFFYSLGPLAEYRRCEQLNNEMGLNEVCGLIGIWSPFRIDFFPLKQLVVLMELFVFRHTYLTATVMYIFNQQLIEQIVIRLIHVKTVFLEASLAKTYTERKRLVMMAIRYHEFVLRYAEGVSNCYRNYNMIHLVQTASILAICGYEAVEKVHFLPIYFMFGYLSALVVVSYSGEKLLNECLSVGDWVYTNIEWYNLETDIQRDLMFVIARSQKPVYLKAGSFGVLNFRTVIAIFKTAYSILAVIQSID